MIKQYIRKAVRYFGYDIHRIAPFPDERSIELPMSEPSAINPVWPLPFRSGGMSCDEIRERYSQYDSWNFAYEFDNGVSLASRYENLVSGSDGAVQPLQRFRHFMPYLMEGENGSLKGKRILDIACNSGFWSIQCALLGAEVTGFDVRTDLVEQANFMKSIVGVNNVEFKALDFWNMSPQLLGGTFDIVLNLGILYHLPNHLEALRLTKSMARNTIVLDTHLYPTRDSLTKVFWEEPIDRDDDSRSGVVIHPSKRSIDLMLRDIGVSEWFEIPIHGNEMPRTYLDGERATWLIKV